MVQLAKQRGKPQEYDLPQLAYPFVQDAMKPDQNRSPSFSKMLCAVVIALTILVSVISIFCVIYMEDLTPLEWLIPSIFTEASVVTGFYSYKAKAENKIKLETRRLILEKVLDGELEDLEIEDEG